MAEIILNSTITTTTLARAATAAGAFDLGVWLGQNYIFVMAAVFILGAYLIWRRKPSGPGEPVDRVEVERERFFDRNRLNTARFLDWINSPRGQPLWFVEAMRPVRLRYLVPKKKKEDEEVPELDIPAAAATQGADGKPLMQAKKAARPKKEPEPDEWVFTDAVALTLRWCRYIPLINKPFRMGSNPLPFGLSFGRREAIYLKTSSMRQLPGYPKETVLERGTTYWMGVNGIYYDDRIPQPTTNANVRDHLAQTELESYSAGTYVTMQELAVAGHDEVAAEALMHHLDIQELREKKQKQRFG
ncbi:MAG: hypothetical protein NT016_01690 [Candidatus Aenigmarchaeota archaeon]|nr:hypothetical protein [Candidatus Aenigmarchaeota archaeon]